MKLDKNDILEILYQIVSLVYTSTDKYDNNIFLIYNGTKIILLQI